MVNKFALTEEEVMTRSVLPVLMGDKANDIEEQVKIYEKEVFENDDFDIENEDAPATEDLINWLGFNPDDIEELLENED